MMDEKQAMKIALAQIDFQEQYRKWLNERCTEGVKSDNPMERHICGQLVAVWNNLFERIIKPTLPEKDCNHDRP